MIVVVVGALLAIAVGEVNSSEIPAVDEVGFAPLRRSERAAAALGPVGPFYPERAARTGRNGEAVIECLQGQAGELKRCKVISESARGYDFGVAAVVMARRKHIFAPGERALGEAVRVRVPFTLGAPVEIEH